MRVVLFALIFVCLTVSSALADAPKVALTTSEGVIVLELDPQKAPVTVENFLTYVQEGQYDRLIHAEGNVCIGMMDGAVGTTAALGEQGWETTQIGRASCRERV